MNAPVDSTNVVAVCSLCGAAVKKLDAAFLCPLEENMIDGAANWFCHGYGSDFDGENWLLCFCNTCLHKMHPLNIWDYVDNKEVDDT
jgi:hypothetical protein